MENSVLDFTTKTRFGVNQAVEITGLKYIPVLNLYTATMLISGNEWRKKDPLTQHKRFFITCIIVDLKIRT